MKRDLTGLVLIGTLLTCVEIGAPRARAQVTSSQRAAWNQPFTPFHVIGNIHYVGATGVSSFLIVTRDGSILLDGALPETAPQISKNIAALGFKVSEVKYLLNSHAHFDHAGGLAELKKLTGATVVISSGDAPAIKAGAPDMPAVMVDRIIRDGETVRLGDTVLTAHVTPGHTRGCTTWTMTAREGERDYRVLFYCSTSVVERLVGNAGYPQIVADFERSFPALRAMQADVFLGPHPDFFDMAGKVNKRKAGGRNPFVDPTELRRFVDDSERQFRRTLAAEQRRAQ